MTLHSSGPPPPPNLAATSRPTSRSNTPNPAMVGGHESRSTSFGLPPSRGSSPSRDHYHDLVKKTYFGYQSAYPVDKDVHRRESAARPPKFLDRPLDPRLNNFRGHAKCKWCATFVPSGSMEEHQSECTLLPIRCSFVDTETGIHCPVVSPGKESMYVHAQKCPFRTKRCENTGCGKQVSIQSLAIHLQHCSFEKVQCLQCGLSLPRNVEPEHQLHCPNAMVSCPLGCGEVLRRGDVAAHMRNTLLRHTPSQTSLSQHHSRQSRADDDPQSVIAFLLSHILALESTAAARRGNTGGAVSAVPSRSTSPRLAALPQPSSHPPPVQHQQQQQLHSLNTSQSDIAFSFQATPQQEGLAQPPPPRFALLVDAGTQTYAFEDFNHERTVPSTGGGAPQPEAANPWRLFHDEVYSRNDDALPLSSEEQHAFLFHQLSWHRSAFEEMLQTLSRVTRSQQKDEVGSLEVSVASLPSSGQSASSPPLLKLTIPTDIDLSEVTQAVAQSMKQLGSWVELQRKKNASLTSSSSSSALDNLIGQWDALDRQWYEWKLAMYDTMFGSE